MELSESERQRLHAEVALAIEYIAPNWPIHTFNARSPLRELEGLPFDQAVRQATALLGGRGYLSNDEYRRLYAAGRITVEGLHESLARLRPDLLSSPPVTVGARQIEPGEVLHLHLTRGIEAVTPTGLRWAIVHQQATARLRPDVPREIRARLTARHSPTGETGREAESRVAGCLWAAVLEVLDLADPSRRGWPEGMETTAHPGDGFRHEGGVTVSELVRELTGIDLVEQINDQMVKWCASFLDEGLARWGMPSRELGFYHAWRDLAPRDQWGWFHGIRNLHRSVRDLPLQPEDAIAASLTRLRVSEEHRTTYLTRHLAQLPGWTGFVRWRSANPDYLWQRRHPIHPVDYLAVRLFYETALAQSVCTRMWNTDAFLPSLLTRAGRHRPGASNDADPNLDRVCREAWRLYHLAQFLGLTPAEVLALSREDIRRVLDWLDRFPPEVHGPVWLEAYEARYREKLLGELTAPERLRGADRPTAQAVFCIDVRSEPLRRHFEAQGSHETFGFAGFFMIPLCFQPFDSTKTSLLCPVLLKPKHHAVESLRSEHGRAALAYARGSRWRELGHHLFHDLKSSPLASYVLIDVMGCIVGLALLLKTVAPAALARLREWMRTRLVPPVATSIRVEKLSGKEVDEILAASERALVAQALAQHAGRPKTSLITTPVIEELRQAALEGRPMRGQEFFGLPPVEFTVVLDELRTKHGLNPGERATRRDRLTAYGFTPGEQAQFVEAVLRTMGLTKNFARLVLFCGHRSRSENNPYAAALDCGACGGNPGGPNARVLAAMANSPKVRAVLADRGITIPEDTWFLAGAYDTTTDCTVLLDLEDVPETHQRDVAHLADGLKKASELVAQERCNWLPGAPHEPSVATAIRHVRRRSADWSQVRPEWGLSGNAAFIVGRRALTRGLNLQGRVFLHSYDHEEDPDGRLLDIIMSAPGVLVEWFSMQYYCSAVDPWVYGSGSKVIHNVVGGVGVMLGCQSDLQTGYPLQTVMSVSRRYHEPMRLFVIVEAPPSRILGIIQHQPVLQRIYNNQWAHLTAREPRTGTWHRYRPGGSWEEMSA